MIFIGPNFFSLFFFRRLGGSNEFEEVIAQRPTPDALYLNVPPNAQPRSQPPARATLLDTLKTTPISYIWCHRVKPEFSEGIVQIIRDLAKNKVRTFILFRTTHENVFIDTFLMHVFAITAKQGCQCGGLAEKLVICRDGRLNCNYLHSVKISPLLFCLVLIKANPNLWMNSLVIDSKRYEIQNFTQDVSRELGLAADFNRLVEFNPDSKLTKRWAKITYGTFYNVAPAYFVPTDQRAESIQSDLSIDNQLEGTADLSPEEEKFIKDLNDPNCAFIEKLLWRYLPIPLTHLHMVNDVAESVYHNLKGVHSVYSKAIDNFMASMDNMTVADLFSQLRNASYAPRFSVHVNYRSRVNSKACIEKWLDYQFGELVNEFLELTYKIVTRSNGKKNTLWLHGPGNAGKTHVMKALCSLFISVGHVKSIEQAATQFPFQGLYNKRIALLDEFKVPENYIDEFKELLGGEAVAVFEVQKRFPLKIFAKV